MSKKFLFFVIVAFTSGLVARTTIRPPEAKIPTGGASKAIPPTGAQIGGKAGVPQPTVEPLLPGLSAQEKELITLAQEEERLYNFALGTFFQGKGEVKTAIDKSFEALKKTQLDLEKRVSSRRAGGYGGASSYGGYRAPYRSSGSGYGSSYYGSGGGRGGYGGSYGGSYGRTGGYGGYGASSYSPRGSGSYKSSWGSGGSSWKPKKRYDFGSASSSSSSDTDDDTKTRSVGGVLGSTTDTADKTTQKNIVKNCTKIIGDKLTSLNRDASGADSNAVKTLLDNVNKRSAALDTLDEKEKNASSVLKDEESSWRTFTPQLVHLMATGQESIRTYIDPLLEYLKTTYADTGYPKTVQDCITQEENGFLNKLAQQGIRRESDIPRQPTQQLTQLAQQIAHFPTHNAFLQSFATHMGHHVEAPKEHTEPAKAAGTGPSTTTPGATPAVTKQAEKKKDKPTFMTKAEGTANAQQIAAQQALAGEIMITLNTLNEHAVDSYEAMKTHAGPHDLTTLTAKLKTRNFPILPPITGELEAWDTFINKLLNAIEAIESRDHNPKKISTSKANRKPGIELLTTVKSKNALRKTIEDRIKERETALENQLKNEPISLAEEDIQNLRLDHTAPGLLERFFRRRHAGLANTPANKALLAVAQKTRNLDAFKILKLKSLKTFLTSMQQNDANWVLAR